jgi:hypothetical protein
MIIENFNAYISDLKIDKFLIDKNYRSIVLGTSLFEFDKFQIKFIHYQKNMNNFFD